MLKSRYVVSALLTGILGAGVAHAAGGTLNFSGGFGSTPPSAHTSLQSGLTGPGGSAAGGSGALSASTQGGSGSGSLSGTLPGGSSSSLNFGSTLKAPTLPAAPSLPTSVPSLPTP